MLAELFKRSRAAAQTTAIKDGRGNKLFFSLNSDVLLYLSVNYLYMNNL